MIRAALLMLMLAAGAATAQSEVDRTWQQAQVWLPGTDTAITPAGLPADIQTRAVVLYAHGCDGLGRITTVSARFLAAAGYLVVAPDSFARAEKPVSCDPAIPRGGLHRAVLTVGFTVAGTVDDFDSRAFEARPLPARSFNPPCM